MKKWLKKVKNKEIINILEDKSLRKKSYSVPSDLDKQVKMNLKRISEEIKAKKKKHTQLFSPRLILSYSTIIIIICFSLFFFLKYNYKNIFIKNPIVKLMLILFMLNELAKQILKRLKIINLLIQMS